MAESNVGDKFDAICRSISTEFEGDEQTPSWAKYIVNSFKILCDELRSSNITLSQRIDQLEVKNSVNEQKIVSLEIKLESKTKELEMLIDDNSQYSRRNCLLIHGVPENKGENIEDVLSKVLSDEDILALSSVKGLIVK